MVLLLFSLNDIEIPSKLNPYSVLGIQTKANINQIKNRFREKMIEVRNNNKSRAILCLAYDILVNPSYYQMKDKDSYVINTNYLSYYYTVIGNGKLLFCEIEENPNILDFKDIHGRNLLYIAAINGHINITEYLINKGKLVNEIQFNGNTPLHAAAYYGHTEIVKLLLNYGANINIKNNFGHSPIDLAMTTEIKNILIEYKNDPILSLFASLKSKNIAKKLFEISYNGNIIAKKILCTLHNLPEQYKSSNIENTWITAWHGTNFKYLESIVEIGLKPPGALLINGEENQVQFSHIQRNVPVNNISDWANAIFVSPSIFYSAHSAYAKEISSNNDQYKVLVEVRVKPFSYYQGKSTCKNYIPKIGEPKKLEYRIEPINEKNVQVFSLTFVKNEFLENSQKYIDAIILRKYED